MKSASFWRCRVWISLMFPAIHHSLNGTADAEQGLSSTPRTLWWFDLTFGPMLKPSRISLGLSSGKHPCYCSIRSIASINKPIVERTRRKHRFDRLLLFSAFGPGGKWIMFCQQRLFPFILNGTILAPFPLFHPVRGNLALIAILLPTGVVYNFSITNSACQQVP